VLQKAKADLERFYPVVDGKPTVAYLWARTVTCKHCRATLPLLKTRWLCKKDNKRVLLTFTPAPIGGERQGEGVGFAIQTDVPKTKGRDADKKLGAGTMSKSGATCPCCNNIMSTQDIRLEGQAGRLGTVMTAVVVDGLKGKEYRTPTDAEIRLAGEAEAELETVFAEIPFGLPTEPLPSKEALGFRVPLYGFDQWHKLFTPRQLVAMGTFVKWTRQARGSMRRVSYPSEWIEALSGFLAACISRLADYSSTICLWALGEFLCHTFTRFALPITWDFVEGNPIGFTSGNYAGALDWVSRFAEHALKAAAHAGEVRASRASAASLGLRELDLILTDPPYYDAIPYSDLMDFFYVWLRRTQHGMSPEIDAEFSSPLSPKWDHSADDGELIDDDSRHGGDAAASKATYERGMARAFQACHAALKPDSRLVIVFAHKQPDAWETLVSAIIHAGFVVDGSWPIQTEREARVRAWASAALSSSVWLVCKKRPETARPGWDNQVLADMRQNIGQRLREYWDAGIRGPDFVWAATGPAMEAYSRYPAVKKANSATGELMSVSEFLGHVRRMVVDFVVGRVLSSPSPLAPLPEGEGSSGLDEVTTYYLLHRNDFGLSEAPIGACILYAVSCGLSDRALSDQYDLLSTSHAASADEETIDASEGEAPEDDGESEPEAASGGGSTARLRPWSQRKRKGMGYDAPNGRPIPLIDQIHRLMHLWKGGDVVKVDDYLNERGQRRNALFLQVLQSLIELSQGDERAILESLSNHVAARGARPENQQAELSIEV
jgi:adenine-specific DNA methylase